MNFQKRYLEDYRMVGDAGLELRAAVVPDETHDSVFPGGLSTGLRYVFAAL